MLVKEIKYTDFDGVEQISVERFHINKPQLILLDQKYGGIEVHLQTLLDAEDVAGLLTFFQEFVAYAYGVKSADGREFVKSEELSRQFMQSAAYEALYDELFTSEDAFTAFFKAVIPAVEPTVPMGRLLDPEPNTKRSR